MKRAHRRAHALLWLILAPAMAATIWLSLRARPADDILVNPELPPSLIEERR